MSALLIALALWFGQPADQPPQPAQSIVGVADASGHKPVKIDNGAVGILLGDRPAP